MNHKDTVSDMVSALEDYAEALGVSLPNAIPDDVNELDELFQDGGEGRCEHFTDLTWEYASQFGTMEDYDNPDGFQAHVWKCITPAIKKLQKKHGRKVEAD